MSNQNDLDRQGKTLDLHNPELHAALDRYWAKNVRIMVTLLLIWAAAGLGCGVLFADWLNNFTLPGTGFPLGFWFAHQGSIITFVLLILAYCLLMNRLDDRHHKEIEKIMNPNNSKLA
jgi:putative solute:sodium symporter small subunit